MDQPTAAPAPVRATTPRDPQDVLRQILDGLAIPGTITVEKQENGLRLLVNTPDPGRLIGRRGQTIAQLQFLVNRILFRHDPQAPRVIIDCEGYRDRQNDELLAKVLEESDRVRRWGDSVLIGPYVQAERKVIEEHFSQDVEIEAIAEGGDETQKKKILLRIRQAPLHAPGQKRG